MTTQTTPQKKFFIHAHIAHFQMLVMSNSARKTSTVGEIVNLMSIDAGRFSSMVHWIHHIWIGPLDVIISMYFLLSEVGTSAFSGFAAISIFIPVHWYLARKSKNHYVSKMALAYLHNAVQNNIASTYWIF